MDQIKFAHYLGQIAAFNKFADENPKIVKEKPKMSNTAKALLAALGIGGVGAAGLGAYHYGPQMMQGLQQYMGRQPAAPDTMPPANPEDTAQGVIPPGRTPASPPQDVGLPGPGMMDKVPEGK